MPAALPAQVPLNPSPDGANNGRTQPGNQAPPGFSILNHQIHVSQLQPSGAIPRNLVLPDSMATLLEYINRMDQVLQNNGVQPSTDSDAQGPPASASDDAYLNQRFPSPEVLASVVERSQQLLGGSASSSLSHGGHLSLSNPPSYRSGAGVVDAPTQGVALALDGEEEGVAAQICGSEVGRRGGDDSDIELLKGQSGLLFILCHTAWRDPVVVPFVCFVVYSLVISPVAPIAIKIIQGEEWEA